MSKELTAINKAIQDVTFLRDKQVDPLIKIAYNMAITCIKLHIETEKQHIIDAYDESIIDYLNRNAGEYSEPKNGEKYYNQKYKP